MGVSLGRYPPLVGIALLYTPVFQNGIKCNICIISNRDMILTSHTWNRCSIGNIPFSHNEVCLHRGWRSHFVIYSTTMPPIGRSSTTWEDDLQPSLLPFQLRLPLWLWMYWGFLAERNPHCDVQQLRPLESGSTHLRAWVPTDVPVLFWWSSSCWSNTFCPVQLYSVRPSGPCLYPCLWTAPTLWGTSALAPSVFSPVKTDSPWMAPRCCSARPLGFGVTVCQTAQVNKNRKTDSWLTFTINYSIFLKNNQFLLHHWINQTNFIPILTNTSLSHRA